MRSCSRARLSAGWIATTRVSGPRGGTASFRALPLTPVESAAACNNAASRDVRCTGVDEMTEKELREIQARLEHDTVPTTDVWQPGRERQLTPTDVRRLISEVRKLRGDMIQDPSGTWTHIGPSV
jgi:hypothetical protein